MVYTFFEKQPIKLQITPFIYLTVWLISGMICVQHAGDLWWSNETTPACCPSLCSVRGEEQCNVRLQSTRQLQVGLTLWQWRSVYFHFLLAISKIVVKLSKWVHPDLCYITGGFKRNQFPTLHAQDATSFARQVDQWPDILSWQLIFFYISWLVKNTMYGAVN